MTQRSHFGLPSGECALMDASHASPSGVSTKSSQPVWKHSSSVISCSSNVGWWRLAFPEEPWWVRFAIELRHRTMARLHGA